MSGNKNEMEEETGEEVEATAQGSEGRCYGGDQDDESGYVSCEEGGDNWEVGGNGEEGPGRRAYKRAKGTPRRPPRGAAPADNGAGWRRDDSARPPADRGVRGLETHPVSRSRSQTCSSGGPEADEETSAALEAAAAVAMGRWAPASFRRRTQRTSVGSPARRPADGRCSSQDLVRGLRPGILDIRRDLAERQRFAARGGVSAAVAIGVSATSSISFNPDEALDVSEDPLLALFGQKRTAVLPMSGMPLQKESEKDWKMCCAQAKEY
jgi:hypothetical protein